MAVFLGILVLHGLQPGPLLFDSESNPNLCPDLGSNCSLRHRFLHRIAPGAPSLPCDAIAIDNFGSICLGNRADWKLGSRSNNRKCARNI